MADIVSTALAPSTVAAPQLELARHGLAVALVPSLGGAEGRDGLALRPLTQGGPKRTLFVAVRRSSAERPALSALVEELAR